MDKNQLHKKLTVFLKCTDGQSMVEFCVGVPVLLFMLCAIIFVTDVYIIKEKTQISARYGAWRLAQLQKGDSIETVEETVESNILSTNFKHYDTDKIKIASVSGYENPEKEADAINKIFAFNGIFGGMLNYIGRVMSGGNDQTRKALKVTYEKPLIIAFHKIDKPGNVLTISSRHVVATNCWDGDNTKVHEPIQGAWNGGKELIGGIVGAFNEGSSDIKNSNDLNENTASDTEKAKIDD